ncbi:MAG TPA: hypothetical protein VFQ61_16800 [Polyangiaceae bacterium]|nr:hypothetical protein [Polyangiaceae bacterium]
MKISALLAMATACLLTSGFAFATHKAWLMKNSGADCQFLSATAGDTVTTGGALKNSTAGNRTALCPQTLASRWGSNGTPVFDARTGVDARHAAVYLNHQTASSAASCYAVMTASTGALYYSATVSDSGAAGVGRITLANQIGDTGAWAAGLGNTIEANEDLYAVGLAYVCTLPPNTSVLGTKVKLCQLSTDCHESGSDAEFDHVGGTSTLRQNVQTNGIECSATQNPSQIVKSENGIKNNGPAANTVFCPIVPPADDTAEVTRDMWFTSVYYSGGSDASNCVSSGTCPSCNLTWTDHAGVVSNGAVIAKDTSATFKLSQNGPVRVGTEVAVGVLCTLPAATTLEGITAQTTITGVQQGGM